MKSVLHPLLIRLRSLSALLAAMTRQLFAWPHDGDFALQRICPFCGLITLRHETCCLECGRKLKATSELKDAQLM
jgi:hypothetical protein